MIPGDFGSDSSQFIKKGQKKTDRMKTFYRFNFLTSGLAAFISKKNAGTYFTVG
jgi:hypothetical protein